MNERSDRDRMIDQINERVRNADSKTVEEVYWFLMLEMES